MVKPNNTRDPLLLADGEPVRCQLMVRVDPPHFWDRCEQWATEKIEADEVLKFREWLEVHPQAIITLYPKPTSIFLCDAHVLHVRECLYLGNSPLT